MKKFVGNKILLSIIIPYHRKKKFFHSTIKSICIQTFKNYEVILIYDDNDYGEIMVQRRHSNKGIHWYIKAEEVRPATETEINSLVDIADIRLQFKKIKQLKDQLLLEEKKLEELLK